MTGNERKVDHIKYMRNVANHRIYIYTVDGGFYMVDECVDHPMESTMRLCETYSEAVNYARLAEDIVEAQYG